MIRGHVTHHVYFALYITCTRKDQQWRTHRILRRISVLWEAVENRRPRPRSSQLFSLLLIQGVWVGFGGHVVTMPAPRPPNPNPTAGSSSSPQASHLPTPRVSQHFEPRNEACRLHDISPTEPPKRDLSTAAPHGNSQPRPFRVCSRLHPSRGQPGAHDDAPPQARPLLRSANARCLLAYRLRSTGLHSSPCARPATGLPCQRHLRVASPGRGRPTARPHSARRCRTCHVVSADDSKCMRPDGSAACCCQRSGTGVHRYALLHCLPNTSQTRTELTNPKRQIRTSTSC
jgi:hypothetical protein